MGACLSFILSRTFAPNTYKKYLSKISSKVAGNEFLVKIKIL